MKVEPYCMTICPGFYPLHKLALIVIKPSCKPQLLAGGPTGPWPLSGAEMSILTRHFGKETRSWLSPYVYC